VTFEAQMPKPLDLQMYHKGVREFKGSRIPHNQGCKVTTACGATLQAR